MRIGLVQYSPTWENKSANMQKLNSVLDCAAPVDLLIFPEMTLTGFSMHPEPLAEAEMGSTYKYFNQLAKDKASAVVFGQITKVGRQYFNTLYFLDAQGEIQNIYNKIHLFSFAGEHHEYTPGITPAMVNYNRMKFGLSICFDLRFPELFRIYAQERVDAIINIANWPERRARHWNALLKARAIENQCYVLAVNRTGDDPQVSYQGDSSIIDPLGEILLSSTEGDSLLTGTIHQDVVDNTRARFPFLNEMTLLKKII